MQYKPGAALYGESQAENEANTKRGRDEGKDRFLLTLSTLNQLCLKLSPRLFSIQANMSIGAILIGKKKSN